MMPTVDGNTVGADTHGVIQGDGGAVDKISGTSGNDYIQGHAAFNQYYGGAGNDNFIINAKFARNSDAHEGASTKFSDLFVYVADFTGAGVAGGDRLAFDGFDSSSLTLLKESNSGTVGAKVFYYTVEDHQGNVFNFAINSLSGSALGAGDFAFYN